MTLQFEPRRAPRQDWLTGEHLEDGWFCYLFSGYQLVLTGPVRESLDEAENAAIQAFLAPPPEPPVEERRARYSAEYGEPGDEPKYNEVRYYNARER